MVLNDIPKPARSKTDYMPPTWNRNQHILHRVESGSSGSGDMAVGQKPVLSRAAPLLQTFVAGPLLQTLVADLCVEYCSLQGACRRTPPSVTNLCREMAAQACYKANLFDSLPYDDMIPV